MQVACGECGKKNELTRDNSSVTYYHLQPWCSWIGVVCKYCGEGSAAFFNPDEFTEEEIHQVLAQVAVICHTTVLERAPREIVRAYDEKFSSDYVRLLFPPPLTSNQEREAHIFDLELENLIDGGDDFFTFSEP